MRSQLWLRAMKQIKCGSASVVQPPPAAAIRLLRSYSTGAYAVFLLLLVLGFFIDIYMPYHFYFTWKTSRIATSIITKAY